ncbi:MAG: MmcQ/YjbR family DNA-binding protein [Christensenellales bacterium]
MHNYPWLHAWCLERPGAVWDFQPAWQAARYLLGGKMFALQGQDKEGQEIISLKLPPLEGELLRDQWPDIVPGYYLNKQHWNSVRLMGRVPDELLRHMVDQSYLSVLHALPKKLQAQIQERRT